jgi:acetyl esterase/lipase
MDPLRDEALIYEDHLRNECGVPTKVDVYEGLPYGAPDFMPMLSAARRAMTDMKAGMEWLLNGRA